jgi:hypothetical protein
MTGTIDCWLCLSRENVKQYSYAIRPDGNAEVIFGINNGTKCYLCDKCLEQFRIETPNTQTK